MPVYEFSNPLLILRVMVTVIGANDVGGDMNVTLERSVAINVITEGVDGLKAMEGVLLIVESLAA